MLPLGVTDVEPVKLPRRAREPRRACNVTRKVRRTFKVVHVQRAQKYLQGIFKTSGTIESEQFALYDRGIFELWRRGRNELNNCIELSSGCLRRPAISACVASFSAKLPLPVRSSTWNSKPPARTEARSGRS